jgi:hypothetical protein
MVFLGVAQSDAELRQWLFCPQSVICCREVMSVDKILAGGLPTTNSISSESYKPLTW